MPSQARVGPRTRTKPCQAPTSPTAVGVLTPAHHQTILTHWEPFCEMSHGKNTLKGRSIPGVARFRFLQEQHSPEAFRTSPPRPDSRLRRPRERPPGVPQGE